jgi:hypothetical protein
MQVSKRIHNLYGCIQQKFIQNFSATIFLSFVLFYEADAFSTFHVKWFQINEIKSLDKIPSLF